MENDRFQVAESKYLRGQPLSDMELILMEMSLGAADARTVIIACGVVLRERGAGIKAKLKARKLLQRLCINAPDYSIALELSIALMLVPQSELRFKAVRNFVYSLVKSEMPSLRANSMAILERLIFFGDRQALLLVKGASRDMNEVVRKNAVSVLGKIEASGS